MQPNIWQALEAGLVRQATILAGQTSLTVVNTACTVDTMLFACLATNDATAILKNVVAADGSFTIRLTAAATGDTKVNYIVLNQES